MAGSRHESVFFGTDYVHSERNMQQKPNQAKDEERGRGGGISQVTRGFPVMHLSAQSSVTGVAGPK